ncbi:UNVERIFIED_CONTAM: hypothetical protein FKN15_028398 [Acipenser sinensis]
MMDFTLVQAWLLYRRDCSDCGIQKKEQLSLLEFKTEVASCLCKQIKINLKRKGRPSHYVEASLAEKRKRGCLGPVPPTPVCQDNTDHWPIWAETRGETCADSSDVFLFAAGRGRQPIDIRLSVMAVTRRDLPIERITGAEALVESCGDGEPQKKKRATEQSISSSRGETLGSPVYER